MNTRTPRKEKILVVDDTPENIWPLINDLETDFEIFFATSGPKALDIASEEEPDLILLDIVMPEMDGYEVLMKLKDNPHTENIPVVFLTVKNSEEDEAKGLMLGAQDYLTKPVSLTVARARIASILNLRREMQHRLRLKEQFETLNQQLEQDVRRKTYEVETTKKALAKAEERYSHLFHNVEPPHEDRDTLLVVDDNPDNIHLLLENLEDTYEMLFATSGEKALALASSTPSPDLILLDVMMPGMDGYEVCARLKANPQTRDIPVIFVTALGQEMDETKGLELGAVDYFTKPLSFPKITARIASALKLKREMDKRMELTARLKDLNQDLEQRVLEKTADLRLAHEHLQASEKRYRDIFENALEGIFQSTLDGRFINASPSMAHLLGYESVESLLAEGANLGVQFFLWPDDFKRFQHMLTSMEEVKTFEAQLRKKNGDEMLAALSARIIKDEHGEPVYCQGFLVDVTELKRMRELLVQTEKMMSLGGLAAGMAHDINNPLGVIIGNIQNVQARFNPAMRKNSIAAEELGLDLELVQEYMKRRKIDDMLVTARNSGFRASSIITNMLDYSRKSDTSFAPQNLNLIIKNALELANRDYELKKSHILSSDSTVLELEESLPLVACGLEEIEQVLFNMIKNAVQAMAEKQTTNQDYTPRLVLRSYQNEHQAIIEIADNGPGMDAERTKRVFEPFFTTKPKGVGTGLGLSVALFIIKDKHSGGLNINSTPNGGTTFVIQLPFVQEQKVETPIGVTL